MPGFLGLHLEGPHLDLRRKGAHDPRLIRPMREADLALLVTRRERLPALIVTLAPASATTRRSRRWPRPGRSSASGTATRPRPRRRPAFAAGARMVTHLFNAMSQLGNREPGLVGAALDAEPR